LCVKQKLGQANKEILQIKRRDLDLERGNDVGERAERSLLSIAIFSLDRLLYFH
jgi:hypothetical protein